MAAQRDVEAELDAVVRRFSDEMLKAVSLEEAKAAAERGENMVVDGDALTALLGLFVFMHDNGAELSRKGAYEPPERTPEYEERIAEWRRELQRRVCFPREAAGSASSARPQAARAPRRRNVRSTPRRARAPGSRSSDDEPADPVVLLAREGAL